MTLSRALSSSLLCLSTSLALGFAASVETFVRLAMIRLMLRRICPS